MSDVDKLQIAEEAAAQRAEDKQRKQREKRHAALREEPVRLTARKGSTTSMLALDQVHPGDNIRLDLPEIDELARSIRELGLLTPMLVRPWHTDADKDGPLPNGADAGRDQYKLIAGHRRHAALGALVDAGVEGYEHVPCEVHADLSVAEAYAMMLTENVQRVPLEPIQAARALRLLLDLNDQMDAATLARSLGMRPAWVQTHLKLLDLPQDVQDRIEAGDLSVTIADLLRRGQSTGRINEEKMVELAQKVANGEITTAQAKAEAGPPPKPHTEAPKTVKMGPDGRPMADAEPAAWKNTEPRTIRDADGGRIERPATPLSTGTSSPPPAPMPADTVFAESAKATAIAAASSDPIPELPMEEQLDVYLLGRALTEWASDDYLEELGIDRVQCEAYADALDFDERIGAIRHLSYVLMQADRALVPA